MSGVSRKVQVKNVDKVDLLMMVDNSNSMADKQAALTSAEELRTVITNLLDNAVKYSGQAVRVTVAVAAPAPDTVWVRVQDRGVGIPRKQLKRIFNRFYRVQARGLRHITGTGLGLYIVRSIARAHSGRLPLGKIPGLHPLQLCAWT